MDIINLIKDIIFYSLLFVVIVVVFMFLGMVILSMVIWDCLIFIVNRTGELLWLKK